MTDEQLLMYHFGTDLASSGITAFALKKTASGILEQLREQTDAMRGTYKPQPQAKSKPQPKQEPVEEEAEEVKTYSEPEEKVYEVQPNVVAVKKNDSHFVSEMEVSDKMPKFGDPTILSEMDKIASKEEAPKTKKRGRGRPRKK